MAETRTEFQEEKILSEVLKNLNTDTLPKNVNLKLPFCVGYNEPTAVDARTKAVMRCGIDGLGKKKYRKVELFLSIKGPGALDAWLNVKENDKFVNREYVDLLRSQGVTVTVSTDYLNSAEYKKADTIFTESVLPKISSLEKTTENDALEKDIIAAKKRPKLKNLSDEIIKNHVIQDTKYVISWLGSKEEQGITIVLHEGFFNLMFNMAQRADELGYRAKSLLLKKLDTKHFENKPIVVEDFDEKNDSDDHPALSQIESHVRRAAGAMYADPADAGRFYAGALQALASSSRPMSIPSSSPAEQKKKKNSPNHAQLFTQAKQTPMPKHKQRSASSSSEDASTDTSDSALLGLNEGMSMNEEMSSPSASPMASSANSSANTSDDETFGTPPKAKVLDKPVTEILKFTLNGNGVNRDTLESAGKGVQEESRQVIALV